MKHDIVKQILIAGKVWGWSGEIIMSNMYNNFRRLLSLEL